MGTWFLSTLLTSVAAGGLALLVAVDTAPERIRSTIDELTDWSTKTYGEMTAPAPAQETGRFLSAPIQRGSLEQVITATGDLQPVDTIEVGSQLPGQISRLYVDFNDLVHKGQPLAELDQRSFVARVDQERSALDVAVASVRMQQAKLDRARIDQDNARATRAVLLARQENAKVLEAAAKRNVDRKAILRSREVASTTTVEEAETELASRQAQLQETTSVLDLNGYNVAAASAEVRRLEAELMQAQAAVPLHEASLRFAQIDLDRTTIRSPIDGVVVGRFVNEGQTIASGLEARTAFNVARDLTAMEIHARVDETDIGRVAPGQRATFTVDAYPGRRFEAVVRQVRKAPQSNQGVVTYTVVLTIDNSSGLLLPGMTALARLTVHREDNVLKVPLAALRFRPAGAPRAQDAGSREASVWVEDARGIIRPVAVRTGASSADQVVLDGGPFKEGDRVVVGEVENAEPMRLFGVRIGL